MTKKKYPFVKQDNSLLEARDSSHDREEGDTDRGLVIPVLKKAVKYTMNEDNFNWWLRLKHYFKELFFFVSRESRVPTIRQIEIEARPPRYKRDEPGWSSPHYVASRQVGIDRRIVAENRCVGALAGRCEIDSYKIVRTKVSQLTKEDGKNTIMVTSARPAEGKTLTSINLALSFAKEFDQTVLLVDCDLTQQHIHKSLGIESKIGLVDYLINGVDLSDLIIWPGIEKFTLISGGRDLPDSTELLGSARMKELISEMKNRYADRYVIFDVPPILVGADALAFAPLVDGIVIVVEAGKTSINDVNKAIALLPQEKILGLVLNKGENT